MKIVIDIDEHIYEQIMADSEVYVLDNEVDRILIENAIYAGTPFSKTIDSLKELSKDHRHYFVGNSCEERAWRLGIEDSIDLLLTESEVQE